MNESVTLLLRSFCFRFYFVRPCETTVFFKRNPVRDAIHGGTQVEYIIDTEIYSRKEDYKEIFKLEIFKVETSIRM